MTGTQTLCLESGFGFAGKVFLGWSDARGSGAERRRFPGGRDKVRAAARDAALELLLRRAEA